MGAAIDASRRNPMYSRDSQYFTLKMKEAAN